MTDEHDDCDRFTLIDSFDEIRAGRWSVATSIDRDGRGWVWGIDHERLRYADDDSPDGGSTNWSAYVDPPPHERLGPLPDDIAGRIHRTTKGTE